MEIKLGKTTEIERVVNGVADAYTVTARVRVSGDVMTGISSGEVTDKEGAQVATFSHYGTLSVNFSTTDAQIMTDTLAAINAYVANCKEGVATMDAESGTETTEE